jgi:hypothetical protein
MPAGSPPGGLDRRFLIGQRLYENIGLDTSVNFQGAARDPVSGNILIAGNNDYVGLVTDGIFGNPVQGAVLPASSNTFLRVAHNFQDGGWLLLDSISAVFRMAADLSVVTNITPPPATTRSGVVCYNGRIFVITSDLGGPDRNIEFSDDNGAIWDDNPGIDTGIRTNGRGIFTNVAQSVLLAIYTGGTSFSVSVDPAGAAGTWTALPAGNSNIPMNDGAISDDGNHICVVSQNGGVATDAGIISPSRNMFQSSAGSGNSIETCTWIEGMGGFMLCSNIGPNLGFVDAADKTRVVPGSWLGEGMSILDGAGVSDGEQMIIPGGTNVCAMTLRGLGQTGLTA